MCGVDELRLCGCADRGRARRPLPPLVAALNRNGLAVMGNVAAERSPYMEAFVAASDNTGELDVPMATLKLRALDKSLRVLRTRTVILF